MLVWVGSWKANNCKIYVTVHVDNNDNNLHHISDHVTLSDAPAHTRYFLLEINVFCGICMCLWLFLFLAPTPFPSERAVRYPFFCCYTKYTKHITHEPVESRRREKEKKQQREPRAIVIPHNRLEKSGWTERMHFQLLHLSKNAWMYIS